MYVGLPMTVACFLGSRWSVYVPENVMLATFGAMAAAAALLMFLPKKEKREIKGMSKLWKQASKELDNPELLIGCVPEFIPYRNEEHIRDLFKRLSIPIRNMLVYDSCFVVQLFG